MSWADAGAASPRPVRRRLFLALDPAAREEGGLSTANRFLVALILLATGLAVLETEPIVATHLAREFAVVELLLGLVFLLEYAARLWSAPEGAPDTAPWRARLRFAISLSGVADLLAVVASLVPVGGPSGLLLRLIRLIRILRLAKLGRMSGAMRNIAAALTARREELAVSAGAGLIIMLVSATCLHIAEGAAQPQAFGSIPRALWWAVATLTTIGYGDVYPVTVPGKVLAAITAISSIGFIAMPAGILAAAFSDALQRGRAGQ